jgi:ribonuclease T2
MKMKHGWIIFTLVGCLLAQLTAQSSRRRGNQGQAGTPGQFDYYLLTLSWAPEFCHSHGESPECGGKHFGFVVHGLWPQYVNGYPESCSNEAGLADPSTMTDIMPDPSLVAHEWGKHGTCSGLNAEQYFKAVRRAFMSIHVPEKFSAPAELLLITPAEVKDAFVQANPQANPKLSPEDMTVSCGNNYLTAVSVCMAKDLKITACQNLRDCRANKIKVPPVR